MPVAIEEKYKSYVPPRGLTPRVERALSYIPETYLHGLSRVILANVEASPKASRRKKFIGGIKMEDAKGYYVPAHNGESPYIVIFVERFFPSGAMPNSLAYELAMINFVQTLYHEVSRHNHLSKRPENGAPERMADEYALDLQKLYFRKRWLIILSRAILHPLRAIRVFVRAIRALERIEKG